MHELDAERLLYERAKPRPGANAPLRLTPLQLLDRLAALGPPPRVYRHRYYGVLAPNPSLRHAVTAMALPAAPARGPPLCDLPDAETVNGDPHAQPAPVYAFDQRLAW